MMMLNKEFYIIPYQLFLLQPPDMKYGISCKAQISKKSLYNLIIIMPQSSSRDLYLVENQYVIVNMNLKRVKKISPHNVSLLQSLKNYFVYRQICLNPLALVVILRLIQNCPATSTPLINVFKSQSQRRMTDTRENYGGSEPPNLYCSVDTWKQIMVAC